MALTTDDVVFLTPGNAPITKEEFAEGVRRVSAKARIEASQELEDIRASGDIASGDVLTVFHRSASGQWRLARDANLMLGAGDPSRV